MRTDPTKTGWIETVTKVITVSRIKLKFQTIKQWVEFHAKEPTIASVKRSHCNRCKVKWAEMEDKEGWINLAVTTEGNLTVCCKCAAELVADKF